jgi:hypothetical protein
MSIALTKTIQEMRARFKEARKPLWGSFCFEMDAAGTFKVKLGYEDCDENGDAIFHEEEVSRRHQERERRLRSTPAGS